MQEVLCLDHVPMVEPLAAHLLQLPVHHFSSYMLAMPYPGHAPLVELALLVVVHLVLLQCHLRENIH